jgi:ribosomal protein S18 acetylase RimI-like enzyme
MTTPFEFMTNMDELDCLASLLESDNRRKGLTVVVPPNRPTGQQMLNVAVFSWEHSGKLVGGVSGETLQSWLTINVIYVMEIVSRRGLGRRLMTMAEEEAVKRGCRIAFVDTMDFLAPGFFQKLGYQKVGEVADWDSQGHARLLFTKHLRPQ